MIFVKIGRGYVENISQYIYYTRNTISGWCFYAKMLSCFFTFGIDFVKMIFCGFLKLMIYLPNNLPILRAYKSLETLYSKAFGQFLIVSHLQ